MYDTIDMIHVLAKSKIKGHDPLCVCTLCRVAHLTDQSVAIQIVGLDVSSED